MKVKIVFVLLLSILVVSCVSKKKYKSQMARVEILRDSVEMVIHQLDQCLADKQKNKTDIENLESVFNLTIKTLCCSNLYTKFVQLRKCHTNQLSSKTA